MASTSFRPDDPARLATLRRQMASVEDALRVGDRPRASKVSAELIALGVESPRLLVLTTYHHLDCGRPAQGLVVAERARKLAPRDVDAINAAANCLAQLNRVEDAIALFEQALELSPDIYITHRNLAFALQQSSRMKRARDHFLRAFTLVPGDSEMAMHVAHLAAQRGDFSEAREYGKRALAINPREVYASFAVASADIAEERFDTARNNLEAIAHNTSFSPTSRAVAESMLGDVQDGLARYADAFQHYERAGEALCEIHAPQFAQPAQGTAVGHVERLVANFSKREPRSWTRGIAGRFVQPVKTHVFILGFPRSGTTFLGQILAAHPQIEVMEERICLEDSFALMEDDARVDRLASMSPHELDPLRSAYWQRVRRQEVSLTKAVFVDKLPLNSVALPLIAKLFPDAKVLFALRDPRDVVFSCFRRRFGMTAQMYEIVTIEKAARYYDAVMALRSAYDRTLDIEIHEIRYEKLVRSFVEGARRLCEIVGVEYDSNIENFVELARERHIDTPSAAQLARGVSDRSGHWRHYRDHLSAVMPILGPWVERYAYPSE